MHGSRVPLCPEPDDHWKEHRYLHTQFRPRCQPGYFTWLLLLAVSHEESMINLRVIIIHSIISSNISLHPPSSPVLPPSPMHFRKINIISIIIIINKMRSLLHPLLALVFVLFLFLIHVSHPIAQFHRLIQLPEPFPFCVEFVFPQSILSWSFFWVKIWMSGRWNRCISGIPCLNFPTTHSWWAASSRSMASYGSDSNHKHRPTWTSRISIQMEL